MYTLITKSNLQDYITMSTADIKLVYMPFHYEMVPVFIVKRDNDILVTFIHNCNVITMRSYANTTSKYICRFDETGTIIPTEKLVEEDNISIELYSKNH